MAPPHLTGASFPRLHNGVGQSSSGTVTGTVGINVNDPVHIRGSGNKKWDGSVTGSAGGTVWNATVTRSPNPAAAGSAQDAKDVKGGGKPNAIETVTVTVTNGDGDSNPVDTNSDIVP